MAPPPPPPPVLVVFGLLSWAWLISPAYSLTCSSQKFTNNNLYAHCLDLPTLSSYLHFTYNSSNTTLSVAFVGSPPSSDGWISWAINPIAPKMGGAQALVAYKDNGVLTLYPYNVSSYSSAAIFKGKIAYQVWDTRAEEEGGLIRLFAKIKLPVAEGTLINHVWQVGPGLADGGALLPHDMGTANLNAKGTLDLNGGQSASTGGGGIDSRTKKKNIHGVLNAVSWGVLFPVGIIMARYLRTFPSADPAWFYLHVSCQVSGYAIGVAGWATGLKLGNQSKGIRFTGHRNIGIALFALATLQIFALFLRPKKDHKFRFYWNIYHHGVGYAILILGVLNVFKGMDILQPQQKWKTTYIGVIAALGGLAALLEVFTWIVVLRRKSDKSTKPYDGGYNNGQSGGP